VGLLLSSDRGRRGRGGEICLFLFEGWKESEGCGNGLFALGVGGRMMGGGGRLGWSGWLEVLKRWVILEKIRPYSSKCKHKLKNSRLHLRHSWG